MALGLVPFAGIGQQLLDAAEVLPPGTPEARRGLAIGQIVGGIFTTLGGVTGGVIGAVETSTGVGAVAGVPTMAASARLVAGGVGNIAAGIQGLSQSLSKGSGRTDAHKTTPVSKEGAREFKVPRSGQSGKEGAKDIPSWAQGHRPFKGESGGHYAERLLNEKYGAGAWDRGPKSEFNQLKKYADRHFEDPK